MTVVLGPKARDRKISDIGDLAGLRLAIESGSLGDAILMTFDKGRLIDSITHLVPARDDLLGALDRGDYDATPDRSRPLRRPPHRASRHGDIRPPAIIIRSAPIAAMSGSPAILP